MIKQTVRVLNWVVVGLVAVAILAVTAAMQQPAAPLNAQTATPPAVDVRPLSDIYANNPPSLTTITHNAAVLHFESSIPVACAVVFGETAAFGSIAADPNMDGAAIIDHNPIMGGLQPDTTYHYRLQGSDANGVFYVSETATFTTAADPSAIEVNIASSANGGTIRGVSSAFSGWDAERAIDDNPATEWSSAGDGNDAWIEVQFDQPAEPHAIEIWSRSMATSSQMFTVTVTTDTGETWGPFHLDDPQASPTSHRFDVTAASAVSSVRLDVVDSSGLNTGLKEISVYAAPAAPLNIGINQMGIGK